jgi:hypothetical protein
MLYLTHDKKKAYKLACEEVLMGQRIDRGGAGIRVSYDTLNSLVHKLLHASSLIVLGRQHLWHLRRALRAQFQLAKSRCALYRDAQLELMWWIARLAQPHEEGVPLASRGSFPMSGDPAVVDSYSDASRERNTAGASGYGAWCVLNGVFCYVERRWTQYEVRNFSINVLEYAAMNIGTFTFLAEARRLGLPVQYIREHTDNSAAEAVAERGRPSTLEMSELTRRRYTRLVDENAYTATFRIASVDNDIADGLSRGGDKLAAAIRMAVSAGLKVRRLAPDPQENNLRLILATQA